MSNSSSWVASWFAPSHLIARQNYICQEMQRVTCIIHPFIAVDLGLSPRKMGDLISGLSLSNPNVKQYCWDPGGIGVGNKNTCTSP